MRFTVRVVVLAVSVLVVAASASGPTRDQKALRSLDERRAAARKVPGGSLEAYRYAEAVIEAYNNGLFERLEKNAAKSKSKPTVSRAAHAREAARLLDRAAQVHAAEAPMLIAVKGAVLVAGGFVDEGIGALQESMRIRPNVTAAAALIIWHGARAELDLVGEVCRATLPTIATAPARYDFMTSCIENVHAATEEGGLAWATDADRDLYYAEKRRRQQQTAAELQEQMDRQEQERQRELDAEECIASCKQSGYRCLGRCNSDACNQACEGSYQACLDRCDVASRR